MSNRVDLLTPPGRMVQGDPFAASATGYQGKALVDKNNQPRSEYFFAIAILKTDPGWPAFWATLQQVAVAGFPQGQSQQQDFSWKVMDGDDPKYLGREGFAGCYVVRCTTGYAIKVYTANGEQQIVNPAQLKRGYFIRAYVSINANGNLEKPGIYINPSMIELIGYGEEIVGGPDGAEIFGGAAAAALPAGASATPVGGGNLAGPGATGAGPGPGPGPGAVVPGPGAVVPGPGAVVPGPGAVVPGPGAVVPAPDFLTPPAPAAPTMTAAAGGVTYEAYIAAGWNDAQLIEKGFMVAPAA